MAEAAVTLVQPAPAVGMDAVGVDAAGMVDAAVGALLRAQGENGTWRDFMLPAGESDGWVTAFVALALAETGRAEGRAAADRAWGHLERSAKPDGGWGYNGATPPDADSTLWGLRLAHALGREDMAVARAAAAQLARHRRPDGGVATYADAMVPRTYVGLPPRVDFTAWALPHVCVTAASGNLPWVGDRSLRDHLLDRQEADGSWPAYWWFDAEYTTAEAATALGPGGAVRRAAAWAAGRIPRLAAGGPRPPAFALAHALRVLAVDGADRHGDAVAAGLQALARWQRPEGDWGPSSRLRVPAPDCAEPRADDAWTQWRGLPADCRTIEDVLRATFTITTLDYRRVYTTATVLRALTALGVGR